jgi:hypothetical protein
LSSPTDTHVVALRQFSEINSPPDPSDATFAVDHDHTPDVRVPTDSMACVPSPPTATHVEELTQLTPSRNPLPEESSGIVADVVQVQDPDTRVPTE